MPHDLVDLVNENSDTCDSVQNSGEISSVFESEGNSHRRSDTRRCYRCGNTGHIRRFCRESRRVDGSYIGR